jgi:hypothetical protein
LMRLFDGYIDRRPLMERDGSGVSALLGLDGFVVCAQLLDDAASGGWRSRPPSTELGARPAVYGRSVMAGDGWWCVTCLRDLANVPATAARPCTSRRLPWSKAGGFRCVSVARHQVPFAFTLVRTVGDGEPACKPECVRLAL